MGLPDLFAGLGEERDLLEAADHPQAVDAMLATLEHDPFDDPGWIYERKLDGVRLLIHRDGDDVRLRTRNDEERNGHFPEIVDAVAGLAVDDVVLDGEVVAFEGDKTSFSRLQGRMGISDPDEARATGIAVYCYLFDVLHLAGQDCRELPLRARKSLMKRAVDFEEPLRFVPHRNGDGLGFLSEACEKGWEGLIAKHASSPYTGSRSKKWRKFKCEARQELVVGGFTDPQGERVGFGALLTGYYEGDDLVYAGKVGTGYDHDTLRWLRDRMDDLEQGDPPFADPPSGSGIHWIEPELVAEVAFTEWTHENKLRHPRFIGLRDDKDPADVVKEG